ncbi:PilZ domain-containing protein [Kiloniella sp. EL199]|uniref:PilZ domain-containing protein n=1 Tax=Kiloniella sp. EL199 TaxID=2107581 RepID=UPI0013C4BBD6|nr:PilZ domain-containing protein [Kiloniella sp. EL199]
MKIRRERPSQRLHHRVSAPIRIDLTDGVYKAHDWSLGGFAINDYQGKTDVGEELPGTLHIPFQGFDISFPFVADVIRKTDDNQLAVKFQDLSEREVEMMTHFVDELVRGSMTSVDDALLRIDTPVTPVPTTPDKNDSKQIPLKRWSLKPILFTLFYICLGALVIGYAGLTAYSYIFRMEINTAVVTAPVEPLKASVTGKIQKVIVPSDVLVPGKTPIVVFEDPKLKEDIDLARIKIDRRAMEVLARQKELESEMAKVNDYRLIAEGEIARLKSRVSTLAHQVKLAHNQMVRLKNLEKKGWMSKARREEIEAQHAKVRGELEEAKILLSERQTLLSTLDEGRYFSSGRFEGNISERQTDLDLALNRVTLAKSELQALMSHRDRLAIHAPSDGRILRFLKLEGNPIKQGETIALFEKDERRTIHAFLTQEEVLEVGLGDKATIFFPSIDERADAFVIKVDRTSGFVEEMQSRYQWRGPKDRSALIVLSFIGLTSEEIRSRFSPGLPAIVIFDRGNTSELTSKVTAMVVERGA